jgi:hypothetical protein
MRSEGEDRPGIQLAVCERILQESSLHLTDPHRTADRRLHQKSQDAVSIALLQRSRTAEIGSQDELFIKVASASSDGLLHASLIKPGEVIRPVGGEGS